MNDNHVVKPFLSVKEQAKKKLPDILKSIKGTGYMASLNDPLKPVRRIQRVPVHSFHEADAWDKALAYGGAIAGPCRKLGAWVHFVSTHNGCKVVLVLNARKVKWKEG